MNVLAIDQGTTGTTAVLYNERGQIRRKAYREVTQHYPQPGWVEHDALEIWRTVEDAVDELCAASDAEIAAVGITNQRETTVVWDRATGEPVYNAIVWQCRRTADVCESLRDHEADVRARTGLPIDAYFSGTKIRWLLDNAGGLAGRDLAVGTIDTWLIWKLTGGRVHATDYTNASRTLIFNIHDLAWDTTLCELLGVPGELLPEVRNSIDDYGSADAIEALRGVPIYGVAGDQQAALVGQAGFGAGQAKNTYGTGCFLLMNTGQDAVASEHGLLTTVAVNGKGGPCYALEGAVFIGGAAIQWVRDELGMIEDAAESEAAARSVDNNAGVYLVPAFVGLGAPHWDMQARGALVGLTRGANRNHIIRASLESMAYQSHDVLVTMEADMGKPIEALAVDGGAAANDFLMQFQADISNKRVVRPSVIESTSLGAACLAGLKAGVWKDAEDFAATRTIESTFTPAMDASTREQLLAGWHKAVRQARAR